MGNGVLLPGLAAPHAALGAAGLDSICPGTSHTMLHFTLYLEISDTFVLLLMLSVQRLQGRKEGGEGSKASELL